ncbi:MAG TPA: hypothetical protein VI612_04970 [Candidatus Nanoarchaeia archaeon]|nr:hypothetical protein [Candidatus Nanoarchaeia archaeon]
MRFAVLFLLFLFACAQEQLSQEQTAFKEMCLTNGHQWMKMSELKEGMMTGKPCYGCMPDEKTHICAQNEYEAYLK